MVLHIHSRVHFNSEFRINLVSRNIRVKIISYCAYFTKLNYHECYSHGALLTRNFSKLRYFDDIFKDSGFTQLADQLVSRGQTTYFSFDMGAEKNKFFSAPISKEK